MPEIPSDSVCISSAHVPGCTPAGETVQPRRVTSGYSAHADLEPESDRGRRETLCPRQVIEYGDPHDFHSGLLNFRAFLAELDKRLSNTPGQEVAITWIDVLNLRREFALWGVAAAESLIDNISESIRSVVDDDSLVGILPGGCFVIAIPCAKNNGRSTNQAQKVLDAILRLGSNGRDAIPDVVAGAAFYPADADRAVDLLRFASIAATRARYTDSPLVLSFEHGMNRRMLREHLFETEISRGLDRGEFHIVYQPKVELTTGKMLGVEALMRWNHPEWGPVAPSEFIPVAERSALIQSVFDFSLRSALTAARLWNCKGVAPGIIAVNASAANLRRSDFVQRVRTGLAEFAIAPVELELEVTESLLLDDEDLFSTRLQELRDIGVRLAIDDFGTRYTGFDLLKRMPLDTMKIDRCFIRGIHHSADMRTLCSTIIAMARHMKLRTVAEGIEESEELEVMQQIGCDAGQGFLFQRPSAVDEFTAFLSEWPQRRLQYDFHASLS